MNRIVRDQLKRAAFAGYKQALRLGVHIIPAHYYAPLPNIIELEPNWHQGRYLMEAVSK